MFYLLIFTIFLKIKTKTFFFEFTYKNKKRFFNSNKYITINKIKKTHNKNLSIYYMHSNIIYKKYIIIANFYKNIILYLLTYIYIVT